MDNRRRSSLRALLRRPESIWLGALLLAVSAALGFIALADEVSEGELGGFDRFVLRAARAHLVHSPDSAVAEIALNVTALGGVPVLVLVLTCITGFLLLTRQPQRAAYVLLATTGGGLLSQALKSLFERARPSVVAPLLRVHSWSFPSGHALGSAVFYLTLGALIAANVQPRTVKIYVLSVALLITMLVGISRVLLGVHYPTDVLAGWMAGLAWALVCWLSFELWERRRRRRERLQSPAK